MNCRCCPYIREEFERKMGMCELLDDVEMSCWCEKTGGKLWMYGQCSDSITRKREQKQRSRKKKRTRRESDLKHKKRAKFLGENLSAYPAPYYPVDKHGNYNREDIAYYKRFYTSDGRNSSSHYHKRLSNKRIRRYKGEIPNGRWCYKLYDYWWNLY